jgi:hypothetical protein
VVWVLEGCKNVISHRSSRASCVEEREKRKSRGWLMMDSSDSLPTAFAGKDDFLQGVGDLINLDYATPTTTEEDRREDSLLNHLTQLVRFLSNPSERAG